MPKHTQLKTLIKKPFPSFSTSTLPTKKWSPKSLLSAKQTHQQHIVRGLASTDPITIISIYTHSDSHNHAIKLLERLSPSSSAVYWWNELIKMRLPFFPKESIEMFVRMLRLGWEPDGYTFPYVLKACGEIRGNGFLGFCVHGVVVKNGLGNCNVFVCNALVMMYFKSGVLRDARKVFDAMCDRGVEDVVSWNSIVAAYVQSGDVKGALRLFERMGRRGEFGIRADAVSLVNVLPACGVGKAWRRGKEVHGYAVRSGLCEDVFVGNAIVDMYAKCELMDEASKVFERMKVKDVVSWNAMVTGYSQVGRFEDALSLFERMKMEKIDLNVVTWSAVIGAYAQRGLGYEALDVFRQMQLSGSEPNIITLLSLLSGCASVGALLQGKETHCYAMKEILNVSTNDPGDNMMVINGIIDMYAKCKSANIARAIFDSIALEDRNVVTWTVMIGGYAQHGEANDALQLFSEMLAQNNYVMPNAFTISCALMACARLAALRFGRQIHAYVIRNHFESSTFFVANCLIDMYVKSGDVDTARVIFDNMDNKNSVSWTSLMTGYGMHGRGEEAIRVFDGMRRAGMLIDGVTFVVVLYACSHSGMVDQGMEYFHRMDRDYSVVPGVEHYACMVDLLGRAGRLNEAVNFIKEMPMDPSPIVWVALLSACRLHTNVELGEFAAAELLKLEAENDGSYTLLSNIYANARRWKDVARIRSLMKYSGIRKRPGCSWVQGKKGTATFFVGDKTHPRSHEIYDLLADLIHRITALGYVPDTRFALHDVDDEEKGGLLFEHSEKLALSYGILTSTPGMPIRITKNLRVCGDCHTAIAYISKIIDHEVIIRDSSRFHHFKDGSCSCKGYW